MHVSNKEQAMDITQEAFTHFWKSLKSGNDIKNSRAFIFSIASRLIIDWYRKKKIISIDSNEDLDKENYDYISLNNYIDLESEAESRFLISKIKEINHNNREAVYLKYIKDLSPAEIARALGISIDSASVRIHRGLEELKAIMHYTQTKKGWSGPSNSL